MTLPNIWSANYLLSNYTNYLNLNVQFVFISAHLDQGKSWLLGFSWRLYIQPSCQLLLILKKQTEESEESTFFCFYIDFWVFILDDPQRLIIEVGVCVMCYDLAELWLWEEVVWCLLEHKYYYKNLVAVFICWDMNICSYPHNLKCKPKQATHSSKKSKWTL